MKTTSKRAAVIYALVIFFVLGLAFYCGSLVKNANAWAMQPINEHLFVGGELKNAGTIYDANGTPLVETRDGERVYNSDRTIRRATLHLLGDTAGIIASGLQTTYKDELVGYNFVNGVYSMDGSSTGNDIHLTIDADLCATALRALDGRKGTVGVYNYKTGEVLCMVSSPTYDPEDKPDDIDSDTTGKYDGIYLNRFLNGVYTPGSTFKLVTAAAALEYIPDIESQTFTCTGEYETSGGTIICNARSGHGTQTFEEALNNSCNVAFAQIGIQVGAEDMNAEAAKLGFKTNTANPDALKMDRMTIAQSTFDVSNATNADLGWASIGQYSDLVNPYHELLLMGAIANGGTPVLPYVVAGVETPAGLMTQRGEAENGKAYFSGTIADKLSDLMRSNVINSYGDGNFDGMELCAKTGTAEVGGDKEDHAWFVGFSRNEETPLAFVVVVENGGSGRGVALPVARTVMEAACDIVRSR